MTNQQGSTKKNFLLKLKIKAVCIRFSKSSNTDYLLFVRNFALQCVRTCFEARVPRFFKFNRPTDLNFNMNKRQGTLFSFGVKKSRIEGVCDATNNDSSISSLQNDLQDVQNEGKTISTQKEKSAFTLKHMDSYLKFVFIQCHSDTDQMPRHQCVILCYCSGKWSYEAIVTYPTSQHETFRSSQQTHWIIYA